MKFCNVSHTQPAMQLRWPKMVEETILTAYQLMLVDIMAADDVTDNVSILDRGPQ